MRARPRSGKRKVMVIAVAAGRDQLEAAAVSVAVASMLRPRRSVACIVPLEWERAEAELSSAYRATLQLEPARYIGALSIIMDELANPYLHHLAQEQRLVGPRIVSAQHAILLGNGRRQRLIAQRMLQRRVHLEQVYTGD